jgi:hypothetical protein
VFLFVLAALIVIRADELKFCGPAVDADWPAEAAST